MKVNYNNVIGETVMFMALTISLFVTAFATIGMFTYNQKELILNFSIISLVIVLVFLLFAILFSE